MSNKTSVVEIVKNHFSTFKDEKGEKLYIDWVVMIGVPVLLAFLVAIMRIDLGATAYTSIITAGAIFTGLLLNLLVLVYDQKTKILGVNIKGDDPLYINYAIRKRVIDEVHYNISYAIIIGLMSVVIATIGAIGINYSFVIPKVGYVFDFDIWLITFPLILLCVHMLLTILMILKRVHKLISSH